MATDEGEDGPKGDVTKDGNEATYRSPPGRSIVTPKTPFGHIDREVETAVHLWGQLGLPLIKGAPSKPKGKNTTSPRRTSLEQRIDRGKRGVRKGNMLANTRFHQSFMSRVGTDADIATITNAVARIDRGRFQNLDLAPDKVIAFTLLAKRQFLISERVGNRNEKAFIKSLIRHIDAISKLLETLNTHPTLQGLFDRVVGDSIIRSLRNAKIDILFEVEDSQLSTMKKLLYFGSASAISRLCIQLLASSASEILSDIEDSGKIIEYAQYKFVDDLAQIWIAYTGQMPEIGRWFPPSDDDGSSPIRSFPQFVRVLEPKMKVELIRTVLDAFKSGLTADSSKVGNEELDAI